MFSQIPKNISGTFINGGKINAGLYQLIMFATNNCTCYNCAFPEGCVRVLLIGLTHTCHVYSTRTAANM